MSPFLNTFNTRDFAAPVVSCFQCLATLMVIFFSSNYSEIPMLQFVSLAPHPCLSFFPCASVFSTSSLPNRQLQTAISSFLSFLLRLNRPSSFRFFSYVMSSSPLTSLVVLHCAQSSVSMHFLYWGTRNWTFVRCGLTSAK